MNENVKVNAKEMRRMNMRRTMPVRRKGKKKRERKNERKTEKKGSNDKETPVVPELMAGS